MKVNVRCAIRWDFSVLGGPERLDGKTREAAPVSKWPFVIDAGRVLRPAVAFWIWKVKRALMDDLHVIWNCIHRNSIVFAACGFRRAGACFLLSTVEACWFDFCFFFLMYRWRVHWTASHWFFFLESIELAQFETRLWRGRNFAKRAWINTLFSCSTWNF